MSLSKLQTLLPCAAISVIAACGGTPSSARAPAATALGCPVEEVTTRWVDHDVIEAEGCDQRAVLLCPSRDECQVLEQSAVHK